MAEDMVIRPDRQDRARQAPAEAEAKVGDPDLMSAQLDPPKVPVPAPPSGPRFNVEPEAIAILQDVPEAPIDEPPPAPVPPGSSRPMIPATWSMPSTEPPGVRPDAGPMVGAPAAEEPTGNTPAEDDVPDTSITGR
jgi:hypothetical protein